MSSSTTKVVAVRIKNETYEFFADKPLRKVIESLHDLAKRKEVEIKDGRVVIHGSDDQREDVSV